MCFDDLLQGFWKMVLLNHTNQALSIDIQSVGEGGARQPREKLKVDFS